MYRRDPCEHSRSPAEAASPSGTIQWPCRNPSPHGPCRHRSAQPHQPLRSSGRTKRKVRQPDKESPPESSSGRCASTERTRRLVGSSERNRNLSCPIPELALPRHVPDSSCSRSLWRVGSETAAEKGGKWLSAGEK